MVSNLLTSVCKVVVSMGRESGGMYPISFLRFDRFDEVLSTSNVSFSLVVVMTELEYDE